MKNAFLTMACFVLTMVNLIPSSGQTMGDDPLLDIPIHETGQQGDIGRPRTLSLFSACLDTGINVLFVSTLYYVGEVDVVIENLTGYEYDEYSFNSSTTAIFPISGNAGSWRITLSLADGSVYCGVFVL